MRTGSLRNVKVVDLADCERDADGEFKMKGRGASRGPVYEVEPREILDVEYNPGRHWLVEDPGVPGGVAVAAEPEPEADDDE